MPWLQLTMQQWIGNEKGHYPLSFSTKYSLILKLKLAKFFFKLQERLVDLANYQAEPDLVQFCVLRFLPYWVIVAYAVFLAIWTLDQSDYPWSIYFSLHLCFFLLLNIYPANLSVEESNFSALYLYKATELKVLVTTWQGLQLITSNCTLKAIHEKYLHEKWSAWRSLLINFAACLLSIGEMVLVLDFLLWALLRHRRLVSLLDYLLLVQMVSVLDFFSYEHYCVPLLRFLTLAQGRERRKVSKSAPNKFLSSLDNISLRV